MVAKHIKSLLYDHDCVIIPEFGGLITRYVSASIHPVKHTFAPPSKMIAFNEKLILNDGLLISTIAYHNNISAPEAQRLVASFVLNAKNTLHTDKKFVLSDIGVFRYNAERKLVFEHTEQDNMLEASFGLPEFTARPIRTEESKVLRTLLKEQDKKITQASTPFRRGLRKAYRVAAGLTLIGLTSSALYLLSLQTDYNLSSLNPVSLLQVNNPFKAEQEVDRYAKDFVPYTIEERTEAMGSLTSRAGIYAPGELDIEEDFDLVIGLDEGEAAALENGLQEDQIQQGIEAAEVVADEPVVLVKEATGRYYIITGGFSQQENAEFSRDQSIAKGFEAKVLVPGPASKLYRVSVADFATEEEANGALTSLRKSFGETIWVFNN